MSRTTHPTATINRDRGERRRQTKRVRSNRCKAAVAIAPDIVDPDTLVPGTMEHHQVALGCQRAGCGLCKPERGRRGRSNARRGFEKRTWIRDAVQQLEGFGV